MFTPLAKLAIGLSATMATGFYYLAAAPPASAIDVCGPFNYSNACAPDSPASPPSPTSSPTESLRDPVEQLPIVESPLATPEPIPSVPLVVESPVPTAIVEPVVPTPLVVESPVPTAIVEPVVPTPLVVESPAPTAIVEPVVPTPLVVESPAPIPEAILPLPPVSAPAVIANPIAAPSPTFANIYTNTTALRTTAIPEPGAVVALLLIGAGIIYSGRKRNKQVGQQR